MGKNIYQVYLQNPVTVNDSLDLMYFGRSPYGSTDDIAMTYANFIEQLVGPGLAGQFAYYSANGSKLNPGNFVAGTGISISQGGNNFTFAVDGAGVATAILGTNHQVYANGTYGTLETGNVTLSLPQDIDTTSDVQFNSIRTGTIYDATYNLIVGVFGNPSALAVNYLSFFGNLTGDAPGISALGTDPNIGFQIDTTGDASVTLNTQAATKPVLTLNSGTGAQHTTNLFAPNTAGLKNYTFPDVTGTFCILNASANAATNGYIPIGDGSTFTSAALTAGAGISITNASGSVTIASSGSAGWVNQNTSSVTMTANKGYTTNNGASLVTYTLPTTAAVGDFVEILGLSSGGWKIAQAAGQQIFASPSNTTAGVGGSIASTNQYNNVRLRCIVANTTWTVVSQQSAGLTIV